MSKFSKSLYNLAVWFKKNARALPWRDNPAPYNVWISEIMLQQTTVAAVVPFFNKFLSRFPDVNSLARAPLDDVLRYWAGLGYYSRAKNLHRAAGIIAGNGAFPQSKEEWLKLPGVGEYTAGAILSIAYNKPEPILDANVRRVITRLRMLKAGTNKKIFWKWSRLIIDCAYNLNIPPRTVNQSLMELGALICISNNPFCIKCPLSVICKAYKTGNSNNYPARVKKNWVKVHEKVYCFINDKNEVLLERNINGRWRRGLWDFPPEIPEVFLHQAEKQTAVVMNSRYTVTNHRVERNIHIYHINSSKRVLNNEMRWVPLFPPDSSSVAVGSPVKKSLFRINDFIKKERRLPDGD